MKELFNITDVESGTRAAIISTTYSEPHKFYILEDEETEEDVKDEILEGFEVQAIATIE